MEGKVYRIDDLAGRGLGTAEDCSDAVDTVFDNLVRETISEKRADLLLDAVGKRISIESLKLRAGIMPSSRLPGFYQKQLQGR